MNENNQDPIVSSRLRPPLTRSAKQRFPLLPVALLGALFLSLESVLLRSQWQLNFFSTYSVLDTTWHMATLFIAALWFCLLMPKALQVVFFILQLPVALFLFGSFRLLDEPATLGAINLILNDTALTEQVLLKALESPLMAVFVVLFVMKLACALLSPPFEAKKRLPSGALLFMACCITLVPAQHSTISIFSTTRSPTYKVMATASIERHGYIFTWLAEAKSQTWKDCYLPPEILRNALTKSPPDYSSEHPPQNAPKSLLK